MEKEKVNDEPSAYVAADAIENKHLFVKRVNFVAYVLVAMAFIAVLWNYKVVNDYIMYLYHHRGQDFELFVLAGFVAQMIDGALGMAYGVSASTFLLSFGVPPAAASASIHTSEIF